MNLIDMGTNIEHQSKIAIKPYAFVAIETPGHFPLKIP